MNTAEWILVVFLSVALFIFLILGCILIVKLINLTKEAQEVIAKGQDIADKADGIVDNVRNYTSVGGAASALGSLIGSIKANKNQRKDK